MSSEDKRTLAGPDGAAADAATAQGARTATDGTRSEAPVDVTGPDGAELDMVTPLGDGDRANTQSRATVSGARADRTEPTIAMFFGREKAHPKPLTGPRGTAIESTYIEKPLSVALTPASSRWLIAPYVTPLQRRIGSDPIAAGATLEMRLFLARVVDPEGERDSYRKVVKARDEWWCGAIRERIDHVFDELNPVVWTDSAGLTLAWRLPEPFAIATAADARRWREFHLAVQARLSTQYEVTIDADAADFYALVRAPTRQPAGDPRNVPVLTIVPYPRPESPRSERSSSTHKDTTEARSPGLRSRPMTRVDGSPRATDAASSHVPVLRAQAIQGYPKHRHTTVHHHAEYMALEDALTRHFPYDAHFIAHCNPEVDRRIGKDVFDDAQALAAIGGEVRMVLDVFDIDCESAHRASGGTGDTPAPDDWWIAEIAKIEALRLKHGNVFCYRTRGGYRLVARLPQPILLRTTADADAWSRRYLERVAYLQIVVGIYADPSCKNFGRLYRLPHATRDGVAAPEDRETIGEPSQLGTLNVEPSPEVIALADTLTKKKTASGRTTRKKLPRRPGQALADTSRGVLYYAIDARGDLGPEIEPGKWAVKCPWEDAHSKGQRHNTSTVLFAPRAEEGETLGYLHCSHGHCEMRTTRDVLGTFVTEELDAAKKRATDSFTPAKEVIGRIPAGSTPSQIEAVFVGELLPFACNCTRVQRTELVAEAKRLHKLSAPTTSALGSSLEAAVKEAARAQSEESAGTPEPDSDDDDDDMPVIRLGLDTHRVVDEVLAVLPKAKNLYKRGARLERVVERELDPRQRALDAARQAALDADPTADTDALRPHGFIERAVGSLAIRSYSPSMLKRALSEVVGFERWDDDDWVPCGPSPDILQCVLEDGEWPGAPVLVGIAEHPLIRSDGTIAQTDGYDPGTGYVLRIPPGMPEIPENPSIEEAKARATRLWNLLNDFPWETNADFAAWLCLALTLVLRDAFRRPSPLFAITANIRGAGKTRLVDVASIIVTGRPASRATLPSDEAETGKLLTAIALEGDALVLIDNADRPIGNGKFDAWFTGERWKDRLLGVNETIDAAITTTLAVSGNNLSYVGDLVDRVLPTRLMSQLENPRARNGFLIPDLLGHVRDHRLELLADLLTIARAWFVAGCGRSPDMTWGSFEGWTSVIPQMVRWLTSINPLDTRTSIATDDPADVALRVVLDSWKTIETAELTASLTARQFVEAVTRRHFADVAAALETLAPGRGGDQVDVQRLGCVLRHAKRRMIGGKRLEEAGSSHGSLRWTVK